MFESLTKEVLFKNEKKAPSAWSGAILNEKNDSKKKKKNDCCG